MELEYRIIGKVDEDKYGTWESKCGCSGYIDENFDAVIGYPCEKHKGIERIKF